jgi:hypothetical protein
MKRSEKLIKEYRGLKYWWDGFYNKIWQVTALRGDATDNTLRWEIEKRIMEINTLIKNHYGPKIGREIISEQK